MFHNSNNHGLCEIYTHIYLLLLQGEILRGMDGLGCKEKRVPVRGLGCLPSNLHKKKKKEGKSNISLSKHITFYLPG